MEKLELHHIAPYLPYELGIESIYRSMGYMGGFTIRILDIDAIYRFGIEEIKPILRPMSDLDKEILFNGEKIIVKNLLSDSLRMQMDILSIPSIVDLKVTDYQTLLKYHFDIFGLIEKGLATDINTLKS